MSIELVLGLDIETTGLDENLDGIMEIGYQVIAPDFSVVEEGSEVFRCTPEQYVRMNPEVTGQHVRSGLLQASRESCFTIENARVWLEEVIRKHFPKGNAILLGSSIGFDRKFLKAQLPSVEKLHHYRMIDASSIREALRIFGAKHRAIDDIKNSVKLVREFVESCS